MGDLFTAHLNGHPFSPLNSVGTRCADLSQARESATSTLCQFKASRTDVFRNGVFKGAITRSRPLFAKEETYSYSGYF